MASTVRLEFFAFLHVSNVKTLKGTELYDWAINFICSFVSSIKRVNGHYRRQNTYVVDKPIKQEVFDKRGSSEKKIGTKYKIKLQPEAVIDGQVTQTGLSPVCVTLLIFDYIFKRYASVAKSSLNAESQVWTLAETAAFMFFLIKTCLNDAEHDTSETTFQCRKIVDVNELREVNATRKSEAKKRRQKTNSELTCDSFLEAFYTSSDMLKVKLKELLNSSKDKSKSKIKEYTTFIARAYDLQSKFNKCGDNKEEDREQIQLEAQTLFTEILKN